MVNPVTGPFVSVSNSHIHTTDVAVSYRQKPPFDQSLQYTRQVYTGSREDWTAVWKAGPDDTRYVDFGHYGPVKDVSFGPQSSPDYGRYRTHTTNLAYEKLKGLVSEQAGWAETVAQASSAREMFNLRALQVWDIVRFLAGKGRNTPPKSLVKGKFPKRDLDLLRRAKKPSSTFLEVEYGWRPLIGDIASSVKIMCSEPDIVWRSASQRSAWNEVVNDYVSLGGGAYNRSVDKRSFEVRIRMGSGFVVTNPNLFLASRLGFIDPALPWKLIPYSFVVDWFFNVEQVASSISDWFGLSLLQPYTTVYGKAFRKEHHATASQSLIAGLDTSSGYIENVGVEVDRTLGLTGPSLVLKPFRGFSIERGLQAIALIITGLGGMSSKSHYNR